MMEMLLPATVVAIEAFDDIPGEKPFPGEEDLIAKAVAERRREFITARRCARTALRAFGYLDAPIRTGPEREPQWPAGMTGSITHCAGYRSAAVARIADMSLLGIDAEPHGPLPDGVIERIARPAEKDMLGRLGITHPGVHWGRLLFSAKESVYKAWFPVTRRRLGFKQAWLTVDPDSGTFNARLPADGTRIDGRPQLTVWPGRFTIDRGLVLTAVFAR